MDDSVRQYKLTKVTREEGEVEKKKKTHVLKETEKKANILPQKWVTGLLTVKTGCTKTRREGLPEAHINCDSD